MQSIFVIFVVIIAFSVLAGVVATKRQKETTQNNSHEAFFLGGRSISWPLLFMTLLGTQVGGGFILGTSDSCYELGLMGAMYSLGLSFGMLILGFGVASRLRKLEINTMSDIFEKKYGSVVLKQLSGIFSILSMGGILMALAIGLRKFLLSMSITEDWLFLAAWLGVIAYTTHGGFLAVVWTDCVQATGMLITLAISFLWIVVPNIDRVVETALTLPLSWSNIPFSALIIPTLFMLIEQDMAQRAFSAKTAKDATKACLLTALALFFLTLIPTAFGLLARNASITPDGRSVFILVSKALAPEWIFLAASSAVLLAILSTASSVLLAVSSNAIQDIHGLSSVSPKKMTFWIGVTAGLLSYIGQDIISWMVASYEVSVYTLFIPIMVGVFTSKKQCSERSALFSIVCGGVAFVSTPLWSPFFQSDLMKVIIPLATSFCGYGFSEIAFNSQKKKAEASV